MNDLVLVATDKDTVASRTSSDIKIMRVRDGVYKALVHVERDMDHVTFSSRRVDSFSKAEAIGAAANEILFNMLETLATPQE